MAKTTAATTSDSKKLSNTAIREKLRHATPRAIERLVELIESRNPSVAMGAAKTVLSKVIPDLKATELTTTDEEGKPVPILAGAAQLASRYVTDDQLERIAKKTPEQMLEDLKKQPPDSLKHFITQLGQELEKRESHD